MEEYMKQAKAPTLSSANGNGVAQSVKASANEALLRDDSLSPEEIIAVTAYFHSQRRGFAPGNELADWVQAEADCKNRYSWGS
jgi:hypothetical protein